MAKFKVELDRVACQGFGVCADLCPQFFQLSDIDGKTDIQGAEKITERDEVVKESLEMDELDCVREAAEACPYNAIHILNVETGEKLI